MRTTKSQMFPLLTSTFFAHLLPHDNHSLKVTQCSVPFSLPLFPCFSLQAHLSVFLSSFSVLLEKSLFFCPYFIFLCLCVSFNPSVCLPFLIYIRFSHLWLYFYLSDGLSLFLLLFSLCLYQSTYQSMSKSLSAFLSINLSIQAPIEYSFCWISLESLQPTICHAAIFCLQNQPASIFTTIVTEFSFLSRC